MAKASLEREEVEAFLEVVEAIEKNMPLIKKIYNKMNLKSDLKTIRKSEDYHDMTDYLGPQKCEDCND
tara:strand:- start:18633 stop:18836 length:204 start_codon:yes stop_codon:yes gene_type:complete